MTAANPMRVALTELTSLRTGDIVEATPLGGRLTYHGEVDTVVPAHGVLWILHGALKERKLLDASEYQIHRCPSGASAEPSPVDTPARQDPGTLLS